MKLYWGGTGRIGENCLRLGVEYSLSGLGLCGKEVTDAPFRLHI